MDKFTMSRKERERVIVFKKLVDREITQKVAAKMLKVSSRWIREKKKRYLKDDDAGLIHGSRGKTNNRRWDEKNRALAVELLTPEWNRVRSNFYSRKTGRAPWH